MTRRRWAEISPLLVALLSSVSAGELFVALPYYSLNLEASNTQVGLICGLTIMGWVSTGHEGAALNRALGRFNASWSCGLIIGPVVGGWLYDLATPLPFAIAALFQVVCVLILWSVRQDSVVHSESNCATANTMQPVDPRTPSFRRMARVGLVCGYVVFGLLRYQFPGLASHLGIDASKYGPIGTTFSASMAIGFVILGRMAWWHYRAALMWAVQATLGMLLLIACYAGGFGHLILCAALTGPFVSFLYASHLYYGVSGGRRRARLMAIHESLLSTGFLIGAFGGGVVADWLGLRMPYLVGCGLLLAGVVLEIMLNRLLTPSTAPGTSDAPVESQTSNS